MILDQTYLLLKTKYKNRINDLVITDARIGLFLTAVKLSDGSTGASGTYVESNPHSGKNERDFSNFSPSKIKGQRVVDLFEDGSSIKIINSLKAAVLNAISSKIISESNYKIVYNTDPVEMIDLSKKKTITIVGAFHSYIKKIAETKNKLYVLEFDVNTLDADKKQFYVPAEKYSEVLPVSDIVIITGLTLVNNTLDNLLLHILPQSQVIVTGPSSSMIPDILFEKNVKIVGSTRITNQEMLFQIAGEAGTGFHLFRYCAEKYCIINE